MSLWHLHKVALILLLATFVGAATARAQPPSLSAGPEIRISDNVFVIPDRHARSITGWLIVLAGCADEANGQCKGIAHYLEHLLFINRDSDNRSKVAMFADGSGNGWTTHRATAYFQRFPAQPNTKAQNLDKLIGYFAGLLTDVRVDGPQADRERNVVLQEYQQNTGRNPFARFSIALSLALMPDEPLGQRVIGSPETIKAFTPEAAREFHQRWYARNNSIIVLHGPIDRQDIEPLVAAHIAPLPAKPIPPHVWKTERKYEPGQQLLRSTEKDARQTAIYLEKIVTFEESPQLRAELDAAGYVLGGFLSSRLAASPLEILMERDGLVTDARLSVGRIRDGTARISFSASPAAGVAPEKVLEAARTYMANLHRAGLSQEIVDRLKMRVRNERALLAEQPASYAQALTNWLSAHGTYEQWHARHTDLERVTPDSISRLLAIVAAPGREVAGILLPGSQPAAGISPDRDGARAPVPAESAPQVDGER